MYCCSYFCRRCCYCCPVAVVVTAVAANAVISTGVATAATTIVAITAPLQVLPLLLFLLLLLLPYCCCYLPLAPNSRYTRIITAVSCFSMSNGGSCARVTVIRSMPSSVCVTVTTADVKMECCDYRRLRQLCPPLARACVTDSRAKERALEVLLRHEQQLVCRMCVCGWTYSLWCAHLSVHSSMPHMYV